MCRWGRGVDLRSSSATLSLQIVIHEPVLSTLALLTKPDKPVMSLSLSIPSLVLIREGPSTLTISTNGC